MPRNSLHSGRKASYDVRSLGSDGQFQFEFEFLKSTKSLIWFQMKMKLKEPLFGAKVLHDSIRWPLKVQLPK